MSAAGTWLQLSISVDQEAVEAVSEILSAAAPGGVSVEIPFSTQQEGLQAEVIAGAPATIRAYLPAVDRAEADRAVAGVRERLGHLTAFELRPIGDLEIDTVHEEDWADAWKQHFPVMRVGRRFVIRPTWRDYESRAGDVVIALDPGMAFGTGLHPTTRLCLVGLERWAEAGLVEGAGVLDVGSGSGILSVGAALLGAADVTAVDTDPIAMESTAANARRNGVTIRTRQGGLPLPPDGIERSGASVAPGEGGGAAGAFDLVLANLVANLLIELAPQLAAVTRPGDAAGGSGGRLLASGIFRDREAEVRAAFEAAGLSILGRSEETDWVALDVERPAR